MVGWGAARAKCLRASQHPAPPPPHKMNAGTPHWHGPITARLQGDRRLRQPVSRWDETVGGGVTVSFIWKMCDYPHRVRTLQPIFLLYSILANYASPLAWL